MSKNYLDIIDNTVEEKRHETVVNFIRNEYVPFFQQVRKERPILKTPEVTILSRFEDITVAFQQPKVFTVSHYSQRMTLPGGDSTKSYLMSHDDNAKHTREKSIMLSVLDRDDIAGVRAFVAEESKRILANKSKSKEPFNLVSEYSRIIPTLLSKDYFGFDYISEKKILEWSYWTHYNAFYNYEFNLYSKEQVEKTIEKNKLCIDEIRKYLIKLFIIKYLRFWLTKPFSWIFKIKNTIVERIVAASFSSDIKFSTVIKASNVPGLFNGAVETTSGAVIQAVHYISNNDQLLEQAKILAKNGQIEEFDAMIWEALRFAPFTPYLIRVMSQDYTIAPGTPRETVLIKGEVIFIPFGSAMQDNNIYDQPEKFKSDRTVFNYNMSLGFGPYDCLGKHIAAAMVPEMCRQLFLAGISSTPTNVDIDFNPSPFPETYNVELSS